jgi:hypothetical protein
MDIKRRHLKMNEEAKEIINFILEETHRYPQNWWAIESNINNIQTIINEACNKAYDEGYKEASKTFNTYRKRGGMIDG